VDAVGLAPTDLAQLHQLHSVSWCSRP
jgi:hypothetical protein